MGYTVQNKCPDCKKYTHEHILRANRTFDYTQFKHPPSPIITAKIPSFGEDKNISNQSPDDEVTVLRAVNKLPKPPAKKKTIRSSSSTSKSPLPSSSSSSTSSFTSSLFATPQFPIFKNITNKNTPCKDFNLPPGVTWDDLQTLYYDHIPITEIIQLKSKIFFKN